MDTSEDPRTAVPETQGGEGDQLTQGPLTQRTQSQELLNPATPDATPGRGEADVIVLEASQAAGATPIVVDPEIPAPATPSRGRTEDAAEDGDGHRDRSRDRERPERSEKPVKSRNRERPKQGSEGSAKD